MQAVAGPTHRFCERSILRLMHPIASFAVVVIAAAPLAGLGQPATAQPEEHGPEEHVPIEIDRELDWDAVLSRAVLRFPRYVELEALEHEAAALQRRSRSLLAGRPALMLGYRSDDPLDNYGLAEYETALTLPLWRFGERGAARRFGARAGDESTAAAVALVWEVAGVLRDALWDIEQAANDVELATEALGVAENIERIGARRHALGDLPLEDTLLAESAVLERQSALVQERAALVDAEFTYQLLTGLTARPPALPETPTTRRDFEDAHPLLSLAAAEVERARAEHEVTVRSAKGSPTLAIGPRRQREPSSTFYADSVGVELSVPVGGGAHTSVTEAASLRRVAAAEAARAQLERRLHADLHDALHTLETTEVALALVARRAEIAARHRDMGQIAFEQGEIALVDLLRRDDAARAAARDARALEVQRGRAVAAVNQAIGVLP